MALDAQRLSRDLDLFHDTTDAVAASWDDDRRIIEADGYAVTPLRERPGFVEAMVARGADTLLVEWVHDSAFRFFPLVEHEELGLTLRPFDLATNKVLALVGRLEVRDWVDVLLCDERRQCEQDGQNTQPRKGPLLSAQERRELNPMATRGPPSRGRRKPGRCVSRPAEWQP